MIAYNHFNVIKETLQGFSRKEGVQYMGHLNKIFIGYTESYEPLIEPLTETGSKPNSFATGSCQLKLQRWKLKTQGQNTRYERVNII